MKINRFGKIVREIHEFSAACLVLAMFAAMIYALVEAMVK